MAIEPGDELDRQDMERLCGGHGAALNDLMERHGTRLYYYLIRQLRDETEAEDFAQETFVRVFQNRGKYDSQYRFSSWLYTIATNLVRDRKRWQGRHPQVSLEAESESTGVGLKDTLPAGGPGPAENLNAAERAAAVRLAVAELPEELRTPLLLVEYEDRSQKEVAAILDCTVKTVEMRIYRARQQLRARLAGLLQ